MTGRATHPSCLLILDDQVEIRVATPTWGKRIWETDAWMKEQAGDDHLVSCTAAETGSTTKFTYGGNHDSN